MLGLRSLDLGVRMKENIVFTTSDMHILHYVYVYIEIVPFHRLQKVDGPCCDFGGRYAMLNA